MELSREAAHAVRAEIARAHGNEVCFVASVDGTGAVVAPRVVARGHDGAVLAAVGDAEAGNVVIHNHPTGDLTPSDADLAIAARLYARGIGLAIVDNAARSLYVVVEPPRAGGLELLDAGVVAALLGPEGPVSRMHPGYEDRPAQREMVRAVAALYNEGGVGLVEAGTGIGKSIAYLVPAVLWSTNNRERTLVSTNTINLQEQLIGKDLPFLRRALGVPFRFALVKGRHNYISIRRARLAAQTGGTLFEDSQSREVAALVTWLETTRDGSVQDLAFTPTPEVWDEVVSDSDVCLRNRCPHFDQCFYQRARRDAAAADILVVNHHLLFSDLAVRRTQGNYTAGAVLPAYRRVILDEAHNLEDAATSHLGASVTRRGLLRQLGRLERRGRGLLGAVEARLRERPADLLQQEALRHIATQLRPRVERARELGADLFARLELMLAASDDGIVRLNEGFTGDSRWVDGPAPVVEGVLVVLDEVARDVARLRERIGLDRTWAEALLGETIELQGVEARLREAATALRLVCAPAEDTLPLVRWLERRGGPRDPNPAARAAPVDLGAALREGLFERVDTAVLTSATLTTADGFSFVRQRLGITAGVRVRESMHPSPFDYERQTLVAVPTDLPMPRGERAGAFDGAVAAVTEDLARLSDGGLFVLFTSYRSMHAVAAELRRRGAEARWPLFVQGESARTRLLDRFRAAGTGVLLGVASFWEGVDVPGDPLRGLILTKLPFRVPTEPLTAARIEAIERDGGDGFMDYMLPQAALRLKQGFGRLVRTRNDRGAIVILDRRVRERGYGRYLMEALPPAPVRTAPWPELRRELRDFYVGGT